MVTFFTKHWNELTKDELYEVMKLRSEVFIVEQKRILLELDNKDRDPRVLHVFGKADGRVCCYARVVPPELSHPKLPRAISIGRVLVAGDHRGQQLGKALFQEALLSVQKTFRNQPLSLYAQQYLESFYASFGFTRLGDSFDDGGIAHVIMTKC